MKKDSIVIKKEKISERECIFIDLDGNTYEDI
jgi:hypothetical protein